MKKIYLTLISITGASLLVACNSGGSSSGGDSSDLTLSSSSKVCSTAPDAANTSITYTLTGTVPGSYYNIAVPTLYGNNKGKLTNVAQSVQASSNTLTITATCQSLIDPSTQLESTVVSNYAVATSGSNLAPVSNQVPYTATKYEDTPIPPKPSACPNGATQCGANSLATQYNGELPTGELVGINNVVATSGETVPLLFTVKDITPPVTVTFTTNNGTLESLNCTFTSDSDSCTINLQTSQNITSYSITPSVSSQNLTPINVSTIASTTINLPIGTYTTRLDFLDAETCEPAWITSTFVVTADAEYSCGQKDSGGEFIAKCYQYDKEAVVVPSYLDDSYHEDPYYYFNGSWKNGTYKSNVYPVSGFGCSAADLTSATDSAVYASNSTTLPYPVESGNSYTKKTFTSVKNLIKAIK